MLHDLRYALRTLRRSPVFTFSAVLALALGVGANVAVFSVVYAVLLKPLPYPEPQRLVVLSELNAAEGRDDGRVSRGTYVDWRERARTVVDIAAYSSGGEALWTIGDRLQVVRVAAVSPPIAGALGVPPALGRWFQDPAPAAASPGVVISDGLWHRAFGSAPNVIGQTILVEGRTRRDVIGVMPRGFSFPDGTDAWVPLNVSPAATPAQRRFISYHALARMAPGVALADVRREFDRLSAQLADAVPEANGGWSSRVVPLAGSDTDAARPALLTLLAAVGGVLLIGCANVANLLMARASARSRELSVRVALGGTTWRIARQSFAEAAVLAAGGTALGIVVGQWISGVLVTLAPPDVPRLADVRLSAALVLFAVAAGAIAALFIGFAPAVHAARVSRAGALRPEIRAVTPRSAFARRLLIGGEVAVVVLLITGALLFLRTFIGLRGVDLGFKPTQVWNVSTRWPLGRMAPTTPGTRPWPRLQHAVDGLIEAVAATPGVDAVGLMTDVPLTGDPYSGTVWRHDAPGASGLTPPADPRDRWKADLSIVTAGYFPALRVPVLRGRNFVDSDRLTDEQLSAKTVSPGVAIVNAAFASRYFPGEDPVGRTLILYDDQTFGWSRTIVGVVADIRSRAVSEEAAPTVFVPHAQHPDVFLPSLLVRSSLPPAAIADVLRDRIKAYDPQLLVQRIRPMDEVVSGALSRPRFNLLLVGSFAVLGLLLAAVGIYGVVSFLVTERTREIGIRMALGAHAGSVVWLVLREGMAPVLAGSVAGVTASVLLTRGIRSLLFGVTPMDPLSVAIAPALLAFVALVACYLPARRASRVDPIVALRDG